MNVLMTCDLEKGHDGEHHVHLPGWCSFGSENWCGHQEYVTIPDLKPFTTFTLPIVNAPWPDIKRILNSEGT